MTLKLVGAIKCSCQICKAWKWCICK